MIANIIISHVCNLQCKHCYMKRETNKSFCNFIRKDWEDISNNLLSLGINDVNFTGGECTLNPVLCNYIKKAKSFFNQVSIFTNGFYLPDSILPVCEHYWISLDGSRNEHELIRNNNIAFERTLNTLDRLQRHNKSVHIQTTVNAINVSSLSSLLPIYKKYSLCIKSISLEAVLNTGNALVNGIGLNAESFPIIRQFKKEVLEQFYYGIFVKDNLFYKQQIIDVVNSPLYKFPLFVDLVSSMAYVFSDKIAVPLRKLNNEYIVKSNENIKKELLYNISDFDDNQLINMEEIIVNNKSQ